MNWKNQADALWKGLRVVVGADRPAGRAAPPPPAGRAPSMASVGREKLRQGKLQAEARDPAAADTLRQAVGYLRDVDDPISLVEALLQLGYRLHAESRPEEALRLLSEAASLANAHGLHAREGEARAVVASLLPQGQGSKGAASVTEARAAEAAWRRGSLQGADSARFVLGAVLINGGAYSDGRAHVAASLATLPDHADDAGLYLAIADLGLERLTRAQQGLVPLAGRVRYADYTLAMVELARGDLGGARDRFTAVARGAPGDTVRLAWLGVAAAEISLGSFSAAEDALMAAQSAGAEPAHIAGARGRIAERQGRYADAVELLRGALAAGEPSAAHRAWLLALIASAELGRDDPAAASGALAEAEAAIGALELPLSRALVTTIRGRVALALGRRAEADACLEAARSRAIEHDLLPTATLCERIAELMADLSATEPSPG